MPAMHERTNRHASSAPDGEAALVRAVGGLTLTAAIINIIVGAGIFMLPALLFTRMGAAAPVAFLAGALAIVPIDCASPRLAAAWRRRVVRTVTSAPASVRSRASSPAR